ncbi:MAG: hypothetical protein AAF551_01075 [Bacteroidota bacterium]
MKHLLLFIMSVALAGSVATAQPMLTKEEKAKAIAFLNATQDELLNPKDSGLFQCRGLKRYVWLNPVSASI